jgi:hypothetical protein
MGTGKANTERKKKKKKEKRKENSPLNNLANMWTLS